MYKKKKFIKFYNLLKYIDVYPVQSFSEFD